MKRKLIACICVIISVIMLVSSCKQDASNTDVEEITDISQLENGSIGVWSGSICETICRESLPNANYLYYNTGADMATSVLQGKTDAFCITPLYFSSIKAEIPGLEALEQPVGSYGIHFLLRPDERGDTICQELNEYIARARESGEIDRINSIWSGDDEDLKVIDRSGLTGENGTLKMAVASDPPVSYIRGDEIVGSEVDIITHFCTEYGYNLEIDILTYSAITPSLQTCKYDIAAACFQYSEERAEVVKFSDKAYDQDIILVVRKNSDTANTSLIDSIKESFDKTFIRYDRWKLFLGGIGETLLITILSMAGGTILGFAVYLLCRSGNRFAAQISRFAMWLIDGTPMVVLLMIFYYIILGKTNIDGIWVAVLCFSLTFGCSVYGMIVSGVKAVGNGQLEGARSLGYTDRQAFFKIILPQAALHFMPAYKTTVVSHIKSTAIVGYIAVQDLTKVSDIIRGNTFEPFFPLFATAAIYFLLAWILTIIVGFVQRAIDSKNRDKSKILSGLKGKDEL